jgi:alpha-mannosidase
LDLPVSLTADRQGRSPDRTACTLTTRVTLRHNSPRLDIATTFDNQARDHRLRVLFPTDIQTEVAAADGHFDVIERPIAIPDRPDWDQPPVPTRHQRYFVDLSDGEAGLAIFNRGLAEYEIIPTPGKNTIAITLLRAVGYLSQSDLATRPAGQAGPADIATPEAQCLGTHTFEYAIAPHAGDWQSIYAAAYQFRTPIYVRNGLESEGFILSVAQRKDWKPEVIRVNDRSGSLPHECSFLTIEPAALHLSAVKRAEEGKRLIIRLYNPTCHSITGKIQLYFPIQAAHEVSLNEVLLDKLPIEKGNSVALEIGAKSIKTIALNIRR